ncbi:MAG: PqqD family protein [Acidobacteriota bacterium]
MSEIWGINKQQQEFEGWVIGYDNIFKLDHISSIIWENINGDRSVNEIINIISEMYPTIDRNTIKNDIIELLTNWVNDRLISLNYKMLESLIKKPKSQRVLTRLEKNQEIDILLSSTPSPYPRDMIILKIFAFPPLGIGYISSLLRQHGFKVECANLAGLDNENIERVLSFITTFCVCYLFFIPLTIVIEEICHSFVIFKKNKNLKKFFLEIRSICSSNNKLIFIKNCSVNFEGNFTYLDYIHFLGGGPLGALLFLIILLPIILLFISNKMFLSSRHLFIIYFLMTVIPINSLFIGKESDGRKAFRIAKENELSTFEFIYEFIKGAFILLPFSMERANLKKKIKNDNIFKEKRKNV